MKLYEMKLFLHNDGGSSKLSKQTLFSREQSEFHNLSTHTKILSVMSVSIVARNRDKCVYICLVSLFIKCTFR